ncbi:MAG: protein-disulfide reductase DsbD [Betaproteobacteria bacterium]|nr:protein-disulfide reductase DsbD [Betaproteobacteria bacterium]
MRFLLLFLLLAPLPGLAAEPDLLPPEKAFQLSARLASSDLVEVRYQIAPGYYMYRDKFSFAVAPEPARLGAPQLPPGKMQRDEFFGDVATYRNEVTIRMPVDGAAALPALMLTVMSQGCADVGVCYVPQEQKAELRGVAFSAGAAAPGTGLSQILSQSSGSVGAQDTMIAALFQGELWLLIAGFFVFGLLLAFTPCVLPMVPILSGIIAGRGHHLTKMHGFLLSAVYVLGMAITYALAGVAAGLSGAMLSAALQNPWVLGAFAAVFVALALAMFGFYELQLPVTLQSRLADASNRLHGGHFAGVFSMGILSALIVGPCVAAPLAGALLYISQSRDVVLGGSALFAMGLGMGAPLLAVGASAGALVPKAGPWMDSVKRFFGVLLLAVAIYLIAPIIPLAVQMLLWAALLIITGVYLRAIDPLPQSARGFEKFSKGLGIIALVAGVAFLVGALAGSRDVLQPLSGLRASASPPKTAAAPVTFQRVGSNAELDAAVKAAAGKPVMLDFYADWCVTCKEMERYTFPDPRVQSRLAQMAKLQADVTANTPDHSALLRRFRLFGPPGIIFFDRGGREIEGLRAIGFQPAEQFALMLDQVLAYR